MSKCPCLIRGDVRRRVTQEQVEPRPERNQGAAELVAQVGQDGSELPLIDEKASDLLTLDSRGGWCGPDFHGLLVPAVVHFGAHADRRGHAPRVSPAILRDDDLIGQQWMAIGQIEHSLMRKLLCVVRTRTPLEDDLVIRVNNMKVTNPAVGDTVDVAFDKLGEF